MKKWVTFISVFGWAFCAHADLFVINDVAVSAVGDSGVAAKEAALARGTQQAFTALLEKVAIVPAGTELPVLAPEDIAVFVQDVVVNSEQTTPSKYTGSLNFNFDAKAVKKFLEGQQIPYLQQEPPRFLMVPVWRENGVEKGIVADNPLYQAALQTPQRLHQFVLPELPVADENGVLPVVDLGATAEQAGVNLTLTVLVEKSGHLYRLRTAEEPAGQVLGAPVDFTVSAQSADMNLVAAKLLEKMNAILAQNWRIVQMLNMGRGGAFQMLVPVAGLADWRAIEQQLKTVQAIEKTAVAGLMGQQILVSVQSRQSMDEVMRQVMQKGFMLEPVGHDKWVLRKIPVETAGVVDMSSL